MGDAQCLGHCNSGVSSSRSKCQTRPGSPKTVEGNDLSRSSESCERIDVEVSIKVEAKELGSSAKRHGRIEQVAQALHAIPVHYSGEVFWRDGSGCQSN